ncbi:MAG: family 10 glycosylhydrolase [Bacteroidales bacterium]|nr:family 10 glycosylhydrolase [Bacteroidales bacterium]
MKRIFALLVLSLLPLGLFAGQSLPVYDAYRTTARIKIDGKLTEKAWAGAAESREFRDIRGEGYPAPTMPTTVKMLWDNDYLYIGATIKETEVKGSLKEHDSIIYKDNDFEVFLDPYCDGKLYYELENNVLGTVMDLMMEKPYSEGGVFIMNWDCKGLQIATSVDGTLNRAGDRDNAWYVEMAIPFDALTREFRDPRLNKVWRVNFSRVEWLKPEGPEENWVWSPTGKVDIHVPSMWGYLRFCEGSFIPELPHAKIVKNWMWERIRKEWSDEQYAAHFKKAYGCGICAILFEGYDERVFRLCKEAGLEAHYWKWTMNRAELLESHPEWFAVNRNGESTSDKPAYVDYYRFLCPSHPEVAEYLAEDYLKCARLKYVDGMHLDYVRYPDVILPVSLWKNYNIEQTSELPEYDYCYCDLCRAKFKEQTGQDPLELKYPQENQSWINFRLDAITTVVEKIHKTLADDGKFLSAAVFPGPSMARKMVRQDWGNWPLKAYFPMIYNGFYYEGPEWIGKSVKESVKAVQGHADIYAGLMFPDIKGEDFEKALDAAYDNGASGISFFDGPDEEGLDRLKAYLEAHDYAPAR